MRRAGARGASLAFAFVAISSCDAQVPALDPSPCLATDAETTPAKMADAFVDAITVRTHIGSTDEPYANFPLVSQLVQDLGLRHIDDSSYPPLSRVEELGKRGVRTQLWVDAQDDYFRSVVTASDAVEGVLLDARTDGTFDEPWLQGRRRLCDDLAAALKANNHAHPLYLVAPDYEPLRALPTIDFGPCVDYGAVHVWTPDGPDVGNELDYQLRAQRDRAAGRAQFLSFDGYSTAEGMRDVVTEAVQAKYLVRVFFEGFDHGFMRVVAEGLLDRTASKRDYWWNMGLVRFDGTPKPAYHALRNAIALLADPGPAFLPGALAYRVDASPSNLHQTLLQKRDGTFWLALWLEVTSNGTDRTSSATLRFPSAAKAVVTYRPHASRGAVTEVAQRESVVVSVDDQVTLVAITPCRP